MSTEPKTKGRWQRWFIAILLIAAMVQCSQIRSLESELDTARVNAINGLHRANQAHTMAEQAQISADEAKEAADEAMEEASRPRY